MVWAPLGPGPSSLVELEIQMDNNSRMVLGQGLAMIRGLLSQAMSAQPATPGLPGGPGLSQALNDYLDLIETVVTGVDNLRIQADVNDQAIVFTKRLRPLSGSTLEAGLTAVPGGVESVAGQLHSSVPVAFAAAVGSTPISQQLVKALLGLTLQLSGAGTGNATANPVDQLVRAWMPMKVASSLDFADGLSYSAIYEFPGRNVSEVSMSLMQTLEASLPAMTGADKLYASTELQQNFRTLAGVSLNRLSLTFNQDQPLLQSPEIRQIMNLLYGGNRVEIEYGIKDERLFTGNPQGLTAALSATPPPAGAWPDANPNTVLLGRVNLARLIRQVISNPAVPLPPEIKSRFERVSPEGTDILLRIDLDGQLHGRVELPLKLLEAFRVMNPALPIP
jgi:hypothetical protein